MTTLIKPDRVGGFPFPVLPAQERRLSFCEVQQPFTLEQAMAEADRCVRCGNPICTEVCPLQTDIRGMCDAVAGGKLEVAFRRIRETNPLPGVTARCCPQLQDLCEKACVLGQVGQPVAAGMIQRFASDWEREISRQTAPTAAPCTGKKIAIVGGGPAGLAAADFLRRYGHAVTIYDELPTMGGTAWYGIPDYHLDKEVLKYEVEKLREAGVGMQTGVKVGRDISFDDLKSDYDAVLIATGSRDVPKSDTPGSDLAGVIDGYRFLEDVFVNGVDAYLRKPKYSLGQDILVIGGGNSALDCARTALRLTGANVTIVYRRTEKEMPVDAVLVEEAKAEGVKLKLLMAPRAYNGSGGRLKSALMSVMKLGERDASGRARPVPTGEEVTIPCDSVLVAIGRSPDSFLSKAIGLNTDKKSSVMIDDHSRTSEPGVFAAGDVVTGESLVVKAMASGREAAQRIHEYLGGLDASHVSMYDYYYVRRTSGRYYEDMLFCTEENRLPP